MHMSHICDTRRSTICLRHITMWHIEENPSDYPSRTSTTLYSNISSDIHRGINTKILLCLRFGIISFDTRRVNKYHKVTSRNIRTTLRRGQVPLRHLIWHSLWVVSYTRLSVCRVRLHISLYIWPFQSCIYTSDSPSRSSTYFVFYSKHLNRRFIVGGVPYILTFHLHYLFGMSIKICLTFCRGLCVKSFSVERSETVFQ